MFSTVAALANRHIPMIIIIHTKFTIYPTGGQMIYFWYFTNYGNRYHEGVVDG